MTKNKYTFDFVDDYKSFKENKLIEVESSSVVVAKEKILALLAKLNSKIIKVRAVNARDYD